MTKARQSAIPNPQSAMRLLVATRSEGKTREIRDLLSGLPFTPVFPDELGVERRLECHLR